MTASDSLAAATCARREMSSMVFVKEQQVPEFIEIGRWAEEAYIVSVLAGRERVCSHQAELRSELGSQVFDCKQPHRLVEHAL